MCRCVLCSRFISVCLSLPLYMSVSLSLFPVCLLLSFSQGICLSLISLSPCLSPALSLSLCICLSLIPLSPFLPICLSLYLSSFLHLSHSLCLPFFCLSLSLLYCVCVYCKIRFVCINSSGPSKQMFGQVTFLHRGSVCVCRWHVPACIKTPSLLAGIWVAQSQLWVI